MHDHARKLYADLLTRMSYTEILDHVRTRVQTVLDERGMPLPESAVVLLDDTTGRTIIVDGPHVWEGDAAAIANECGEEALSALSSRAPSRTSFLRKNGLMDRLWDGSNVKRSFWVFNGFVLLYWLAWFIYFVFSPNFREWYENAGRSSDFGALGLIAFLLLPAVPITAALSARLAARSKLPGYTPARAFFLFELPALLFVFIFNQLITFIPLTFGLRVLMLALALTLLSVWYLAVHRVSFQNAKVRVVHFAAVTTLVVAGVYASLLTIVPAYLAFFEEGLPDMLNELWDGGILILGDPLHVMMLLVSLVLVFMPLFLFAFAARAARRRYYGAYHALCADLPRRAREVEVGVPLVFLVLLFILSAQNSSNKYMEELILLAQDSAGYESAAARASVLADRKERVDDALENTLYADEMYLFDASDFENLSSYEPELSMHYLRIVAFPFVYNDTNNSFVSGTRREVLLRGYERAFGHPFGQDPEKTIAPRNQVELVERDVNVLTNGSSMLAEVTVTDSFTTFVSWDQEVVYEFSLPEHAVVTGLKLGASLEFTGQIAPRGAAQQVYVEQVRGRSDPALLEQTGPRQYRLRVYPVPGTSNAADRSRRERVEGPTQRVQFTYLVIRDKKGIPLPVYGESYNVLDNEVDLSAHLDGADAKLTKDETHVNDPRDATTLCTLTTAIDTVLVPGSTARLVAGAQATQAGVYVPLCATGNPLEQVVGKKVAILADTSYANGDGKLQEALSQLRSLPTDLYTRNTVRLQLFGDTVGSIRAIEAPSQVPDAKDLVYFGKGDVMKALEALEPGYDLVLVLTGDDSPLDTETVSNSRWDTPRTQYQTTSLENIADATVVFVHSDARIPSYPRSLETRLSNARSVEVVIDVVPAMTRALTSAAQGKTYPYIGEYWYLETTPYHERTDLTSVWVGGVEDPYASSEQYSSTSLDDSAMTWEMKAVRAIAERSQLSGLAHSAQKNEYQQFGGVRMFDTLHARARALGIVTPLSSYIALVNNEQQVRLDKLSDDLDRYTSEQRFAVSQPSAFSTPLGGSNPFFAVTRQSATDAGMEVMKGPGSTADFKQGTYDLLNDASGGSSNDETGVLPRILVLLLTLGVLGGGAYAVFRITHRKSKREAK